MVCLIGMVVLNKLAKPKGKMWGSVKYLEGLCWGGQIQQKNSWFLKSKCTNKQYNVIVFKKYLQFASQIKINKNS